MQIKILFCLLQWAKGISFSTKYLSNWGNIAVKRLHYLNRPSNRCVTVGKKNNNFSMAEKARETPKYPTYQAILLLTPLTTESIVTWDPMPYNLCPTHPPNPFRHWEVLHKEVSQTVWLWRYIPFCAFINKLKKNDIMRWCIICPALSSLFLWPPPLRNLT